jgi:signal transduction histidine kinase
VKTSFGKISLAKRYAFFLFAVIALLLLATHVITARVMRDGLRDLFTQRLQRSSATLEHYADVHFISASSEVEAVVTSPRFIAAVETADSATIANEAPHYKRLLEASIFFVEDNEGRLIYGLEGPDHPDGFDRMAMAEVTTLLKEKSSAIHTHYILNRGELYELLHTDVVTFDGLHVGRLLVGQRISDFMINDLERLTGFDALIMHDAELVAKSSSPIIDEWCASPECLASSSVQNSVPSSMILDDREILYLTRVDERLNVSVTFIGDLDANIAPILAEVKDLLIALAGIAGLVAMLAVSLFTSRRIGKQMDNLVNATERIAGGDLDFKMVSQSNDEFGYLTVVIDDMRSRLRKNLLELKQAHTERVNSERLAAVGKSATGIIHDFKGPMAVIRGTVELMLLKHSDDERLRKQCQGIVQQIDHINELMQDVIEYSRGKFNLNIESVNLKRYFTDIRASQLEAFDRAGIDLKIEDAADYTVRLDPARFRRVVDNILNNAREALKPGQTVEISWEMIESNLKLIIQDNGPGIPEEIREKLFEPFVTSGKDTGTGLGLSISKKIVEDHNSTLAVASETGSGAAFIITIPETMVTPTNQNKTFSAIDYSE